MLQKRPMAKLKARRKLQRIINLYKEPALRERIPGRKEENLLHFRRVPDR